MASYSDVLRKRNQAAGLRTRAERSRGLADSYNQFTTSPGNVQGMGMISPTPQNIDWGSIMSRGLASYQSASDEKKASTLESEAEALNEQFMKETLGTDQQAMKFYQLAQAGVPGMDRALAEHIAPRKEAMGAFLQYLQSGQADPDMAAEVAPRFGVSPELATRAAEYNARKMSEASDLEHRREMELQGLRNQGRRMPSTGMTAEGDIALTPGEKQLRGKLMAEADKQIQDISVNEGKFQQTLESVQRDNTFGPSSKVSEVMGDMNNRVISAIGRSMQSEGNLRLKEYVNSEALRRMSLLGGNDSNEELNRITGSLPSALNNKEAALAMLQSLHDWQETVKLALQLRRDDIQSGNWFGRRLTEDDYYRQAKEIRAGGGQRQRQSEGPAGIPTEQINSIEGMLDELGIQ